MELNKAVMNKRLAEFAEGAIARKCGWIIHLADSSTVLCYLHKEDRKSKPFEGVRVMAIQAAGKVKKGVLQEWTWTGSENSLADWVTKL